MDIEREMFLHLVFVIEIEYFKLTVKHLTVTRFKV